MTRKVLAVIAAAGVAVWAFRGEAQEDRAAATETWTRPVPKASCGPKDRVETGLQGQTTLAERMTGASERAYGCNLELVGQFAGEGASWQMSAFDTCAYYGTANGAGQQHKGVVVIDASNPKKPVASGRVSIQSICETRPSRSFCIYGAAKPRLASPTICH